MQLQGSTRKCFTLDEIVLDTPKTATEKLFDIEEIYESYKEELNDELKTTDRVWLEFQAGQCEQFGHVAKSLLYRIVKSSVGHAENSIAAANAITILKTMHVSLSRLNLQGVHIKGADLSNAILDFADMTGADLTDCNLIGASLKNVVLQNAKIKNAIFVASRIISLNSIDVEEVARFIPAKKGFVSFVDKKDILHIVHIENEALHYHISCSTRDMSTVKFCEKSQLLYIHMKERVEVWDYVKQEKIYEVLLQKPKDASVDIYKLMYSCFTESCDTLICVYEKSFSDEHDLPERKNSFDLWTIQKNMDHLIGSLKASMTFPDLITEHAFSSIDSILALRIYDGSKYIFQFVDHSKSCTILKSFEIEKTSKIKFIANKRCFFSIEGESIYTYERTRREQAETASSVIINKQLFLKKCTRDAFDTVSSMQMLPGNIFVYVLDRHQGPSTICFYNCEKKILKEYIFPIVGAYTGIDWTEDGSKLFVVQKNTHFTFDMALFQNGPQYLPVDIQDIFFDTEKNHVRILDGVHKYLEVNASSGEIFSEIQLTHFPLVTPRFSSDLHLFKDMNPIKFLSSDCLLFTHKNIKLYRKNGQEIPIDNDVVVCSPDGLYTVRYDTTKFHFFDVQLQKELLAVEWGDFYKKSLHQDNLTLERNFKSRLLSISSMVDSKFYFSLLDFSHTITIMEIHTTADNKIGEKFSIELGRLNESMYDIVRIKFSPDNKFLLIQDSTLIHVVDIDKRQHTEILHKSTIHNSFILSCDISDATSNFLVELHKKDYEHFISIMDLKTGQKHDEIKYSKIAFSQVKLSADGHLLVAWFAIDIIYVWQICDKKFRLLWKMAGGMDLNEFANDLLELQK